MNEQEKPHPEHYGPAVRMLLRFALVMLVIGLLSGVAFQESAKKLDRSGDADGLRFWDAALNLALVHGHVIMTGVLLPLAMAGMLHLAWSHGGREVGRRGLRTALYLYMPCVSVVVGLMLYKGYHVLLSARRGETDLGAIDSALFGGNVGLRHGLYGISHVGMAVGLCVFVWCLWRSLKVKRG